MIQGLVSASSRLLRTFRSALIGQPAVAVEQQVPAQIRPLERLERVVLTDEVSRTLFQEYAAHRASDRGNEEIGWVLLGRREIDHALVLATLPAGANRDAGVAHVQFNSNAQAVASRIVRQKDSRLLILGVVHTHPGSLRHPSDGDFHGDSAWVDRLRGGEGIFGIGTADGAAGNGVLVGQQPRQHVQGLGPLLISWYALKAGDRQYRPIPIQLTIGPDLALPLHEVWTTMEWFAQPLERLCQQQAKIAFQVVPGRGESALAVMIKLAEPDSALRIVLEGKEAAFYWQRGSELMSVDAPAEQLDRAVYLVLANLTGQS